MKNYKWANLGILALAICSTPMASAFAEDQGVLDPIAKAIVAYDEVLDVGAYTVDTNGTTEFKLEEIESIECNDGMFEFSLKKHLYVPFVMRLNTRAKKIDVKSARYQLSGLNLSPEMKDALNLSRQAEGKLDVEFKSEIGCEEAKTSFFDKNLDFTSEFIVSKSGPKSSIVGSTLEISSNDDSIEMIAIASPEISAQHLRSLEIKSNGKIIPLEAPKQEEAKESDAAVSQPDQAQPAVEPAKQPETAKPEVSVEAVKQ